MVPSWTLLVFSLSCWYVIMHGEAKHDKSTYAFFADSCQRVCDHSKIETCLKLYQPLLRDVLQPRIT